MQGAGEGKKAVLTGEEVHVGELAVFEGKDVGVYKVIERYGRKCILRCDFGLCISWRDQSLLQIKWRATTPSGMRFSHCKCQTAWCLRNGSFWASLTPAIRTRPFLGYVAHLTLAAPTCHAVAGCLMGNCDSESAGGDSSGLDGPGRALPRQYHAFRYQINCRRESCLPRAVFAECLFVFSRNPGAKR